MKSKNPKTKNYKPKQKKKSVIGYARVSTEKQGDDGYGLEYQLDRINDYCKRQKMVVDRIYKESYTGKLNDRKEFNKIINLIEKGEVQTLITFKLDRLGRSQLNILKFIELLKNMPTINSLT